MGKTGAIDGISLLGRTRVKPFNLLVNFHIIDSMVRIHGTPVELELVETLIKFTTTKQF